jgi:hypothetical protein
MPTLARPTHYLLNLSSLSILFVHSTSAQAIPLHRIILGCDLAGSVQSMGTPTLEITRQ